MATALTLFKNVLRKLLPAEVDQNFVNLAATADAAKAVTDTVSATPGANQIPRCGGDGALLLPAYAFLGGSAPATDKRGYLMSSQYDYTAEPEGFFVVGGYSNVTTNTTMIGGGAASYNAATLIQFFTASTTNTRTGVEAMRITSGGRLLVGTTSENTSAGNAKVQSVNGIFLGNSANSAANVLDWYEEGTFTPVAQGVTIVGVGTYTVQNGYYTRIGREVKFRVHLGWTGHTGTGGLLINGLPYVSSSAANNNNAVSAYYNGLTVGAGKELVCFVPPNSTIVNVRAGDPAGGAAVELNGGVLDTAVTSLLIAGTYML